MKGQRQRNQACQQDGYWRKVERDNLDGYGWTMSLDSVRTPEEILLIKQRFERFERHIDNLQPRIGRVLRLRLGINCKPLTFEEIAQQYGITRERVRQMEAKAVRIIKRRIFIEERPEQYRRECEETAKVYAERRRFERQHAAAEAAERKARQDAPAIAAMEAVARRHAPAREAVEDIQRREYYEAQRRAARQFPLHKSGILHEIVKEQHRGRELERQRNSWATERAKWLQSPLPEWAQHEPSSPYLYKMRKVERKPPAQRDWLHVATGGFRDGA